MKWRAIVTIDLKPGVLDAQGEAVRGALERLGHRLAGDVRVGKRIQLTVEAEDQSRAEEAVAAMCQALLVNPVLERYRVEVLPEGGR